MTKNVVAVASKINWVDLAKRVPKKEQGRFMAFKGKSDNYLRRVLASPPEPPKIDWEQYNKLVPVEGLVDKFKSSYEAFKVPRPKDTMSAKVDEQRKKVESDVKTFSADTEKIVNNLNQELSRIKALPKMEDLTMEMYYEMYPDQAIDFVNKPSFWPHHPEEQLGYVSPENRAIKDAEKKK